MIEMILRLFVSGLTMYLEKRALNEQAARDYLAFIEIMNRNGLASVKMRLDAHDQVERVKALWEKENEKPPG